MAIVKAQLGQTSDQVIRAFQKKVLAEDILGELKKREWYQKPAFLRKVKTLAKRRLRKKKR